MISRSPTITNPDWLPNDHAGEMLAGEFLDPLGIELDELAQAIEVPSGSLASVVAGQIAMSGEMDLRLTRYFGLSEGFFLRLQNRYELLEAKRALNGALDRIVPRAA